MLRSHGKRGIAALAACLEAFGLSLVIVPVLLLSLVFAAGARATAWPRDKTADLFVWLAERLSDRLDDLRTGGE